MPYRSVEPPRSLRTLYQSEYYLLGVDHARGAALLRRTGEPFPDLATLAAENKHVIFRLERCELPGIVVDMRSAPPNNDPAFEESMRTLRDAVGRAFVRVVVLVVSAVGELQINRIHSRNHHDFIVTRRSLDAWRLAAGG